MACFERAEELKPGAWKSNKMMIGKTLLKLGRTSEARTVLQQALAMPVTTKDVR